MDPQIQKLNDEINNYKKEANEFMATVEKRDRERRQELKATILDCSLIIAGIVVVSFMFCRIIAYLIPTRRFITANNYSMVKHGVK